MNSYTLAGFTVAPNSEVLWRGARSEDIQQLPRCLIPTIGKAMI
jgi:hypothetical protein